MDSTYDRVRAIARTAYIYAFPIVVHYADLYARAIDPSTPWYSGFGTWRHGSVRSETWVDVRAEPWVLALFRGAGESKPVVRVSDLWGYGVHQSAPAANDDGAESVVVLASPVWIGEVSGEIGRLVRGESSFLRVAISMEAPDGERHGLSAGLAGGQKLRPMSARSGRRRHGASPQPTWMPWIVDDEVTDRFWSCANFAMSLSEPQVEDEGMLHRIAEIGIVPGEPWDPAWFSAEMLEAMSAGMDDALADLLQASHRPLHPERLGQSRRDSDSDYFGRALSAIVEPGLPAPVRSGGEDESSHGSVGHRSL